MFTRGQEREVAAATEPVTGGGPQATPPTAGSPVEARRHPSVPVPGASAPPTPSSTVATTPAGRGRPTGGTFAALRVPNYRRFITGQIISMCGTWMQTIAL